MRGSRAGARSIWRQEKRAGRPDGTPRAGGCGVPGSLGIRRETNMGIVKLALSRPYTFIVLALVLILISPVMLLRTPVDIFPNINIPVISVIWTYSGLAPAEMGTRLASIFERSLTTR